MPAVPNQTQDLAWQQQLTPQEAQNIAEALARQGKTSQEILAELTRIGQQKQAQREQVQREQDAQIARARAASGPALSATIGAPQPGSGSGVTAPSSLNSAKWQHAQADPFAHHLMFGPITPGKGGLGGGVFDAASLVIGPGMAPGVLGRGYKLATVADTAAANGVARLVGGPNVAPIASKLINKGYKEATGERFTDTGWNALQGLGLLGAAAFKE